MLLLGCNDINYCLHNNAGFLGNMALVMEELNLFGYPPTNVLLLFGTEKYEYILDMLDNYFVAPISELVIAFFSENLVDLYQPYRMSMTRVMHVENFGNWSRENGLQLFYKGISSPRRRRNFEKLPITFGSVSFSKTKVVEDVNYDDLLKSKELMFKLDYPMLSSGIQALNGTQYIRFYPSHGYGKLNKTGHYTAKNDLLEGIHTGDIDIAGVLLMAHGREKIVKCITPMEFLGFKFILKKPSLSFMKNIYFITFSNSVWFAILLVTSVFTIAYFITLRFEKKWNLFVNTKVKATLGDIILIALEAFSQQGTMYEPYTFSSRILTLLFFMQFMFIYVAYSAMILVMLSSTVEIKDMSQLLESRIECGGQNYSFMKVYMEAPKTGVLRDLYLRKVYPNNYFDLVPGLQKVQEGNFAFHSSVQEAYEYIIRYYSNYDICGLQELPGYANTKGYFAIRHNSPYKEIYHVWLQRLNEIGLDHRAKNKIISKPKCHNESGSYQSIRIYDCIFVFAVFGYGTLVAIFLFMVEKLVSKYKPMENVTAIVKNVKSTSKLNKF